MPFYEICSSEETIVSNLLCWFALQRVIVLKSTFNFQLNYKCCNILWKIILLTSLFQGEKRRKPKSIIYKVYPQGISSRSWGKAVWEHNDKWSNAKMRARVRAQEVSEDLCQRNQSSDAGSAQEMINLSFAVWLSVFWYINNIRLWNVWSDLLVFQICCFFCCQHNSLSEETRLWLWNRKHQISMEPLSHKTECMTTPDFSLFSI